MSHMMILFKGVRLSSMMFALFLSIALFGNLIGEYFSFENCLPKWILLFMNTGSIVNVFLSAF